MPRNIFQKYLLNVNMNTIKEDIFGYLSKLSPYVEPIKNVCQKYLKYCSIIDSDLSFDKNMAVIPYFEIIRIGHNPCLHWNNYMITLNKGINQSWLSKFKEKTNLTIPKIYENILLEINGCQLFDLDNKSFELYGLSPEKYYPDEYITIENTLYKLSEFWKSYIGRDLEDANSEKWLEKYNFSGFYFGGCSYDSEIRNPLDKIIAYFINNNEIFAVNEEGKILGNYKSFNDFFRIELKIAEEHYFSTINEKDLY